MVSPPTQIVLATRDQELAHSAASRLAESGIRLLNTTEVSETMEAALEGNPSLFIIDAARPVGDVLGLCQALRGVSNKPIIVLLASGIQELDEATLLEAGVDDCMRHPVSHRELVARVRAHLRRRNQPGKDAPRGPMKAGELEIDVAAHSVRRRGSPISLTPLEFNLLLYLVTNRGKVLTRTRLLEKVWAWEYTTSTRTVDVRIRLLRKKIEIDPDCPRLLVTITGVGYRFDG
jgi:DNA-binding response OmpR family regulator